MVPTEENALHRFDADEQASFGVEDHSGCVVVTAAGEVDVRTSPGLRDALQVAAKFAHRIIVDLTQVTLLDSTGLAVLVGARAHVRDREGVIALAGLPSVVSAVLEVTKLNEVFPVYDSLPDAIAALGDS